MSYLRSLALRHNLRYRADNNYADGEVFALSFCKAYAPVCDDWLRFYLRTSACRRRYRSRIQDRIRRVSREPRRGKSAFQYDLLRNGRARRGQKIERRRNRRRFRIVGGCCQRTLFFGYLRIQNLLFGFGLGNALSLSQFFTSARYGYCQRNGCRRGIDGNHLGNVGGNNFNFPYLIPVLRKQMDSGIVRRAYSYNLRTLFQYLFGRILFAFDRLYRRRAYHNVHYRQLHKKTSYVQIERG